MVPMIIFGLSSLVTLGAALAVVTHKNILHSAFYLVLSFVGVASIYVLLEAPFIAVVQVLVYIGAIAILIVFAIMLTRRLYSEDFNSAKCAVGLVCSGCRWLVPGAGLDRVQRKLARGPAGYTGRCHHTHGPGFIEHLCGPL